jgi:hypothetical protein
MTITTESLISECQSLSAICLNNTLNVAYDKALSQAVNLNLEFDFCNKDIQKLLKHNLIIELCEFKKNLPRNSSLYIKKEEFNHNYLKIIDDVVVRMEIYKREKSPNFIKDFIKYLKKNGFSYLSDVYLKRVSNKLALFR